MIAFDDLVELIYESAVVPEVWKEALAGVTELSNSFGSALVVTDITNITQWVTDEALRPVLEEWVAGGWQAKTQRAKRMIALGRDGFISELDVYTHEELDADPSYVEFLRPRGIGWAAGSYVELAGGDRAIFNIERRLSSGPPPQDDIATLNRLRPHLARSALLSARLKLKSAQTATKVLDGLGIPAAVIGSGARIIDSNDLFSSMEEVSSGLRGRLVLKDEKQQKKLSESDLYESSVRPRSLGLPGVDDIPPLVLHIVPVSRTAIDIFGSGLAVLVVTVFGRTPEIDPDIIATLFDLTPSEAKVARLIAKGGGVDAAALDLNLSRETVRSHLKGIFSKTGARTQAEIAALLSSARTKLR